MSGLWQTEILLGPSHTLSLSGDDSDGPSLGGLMGMVQGLRSCVDQSFDITKSTALVPHSATGLPVIVVAGYLLLHCCSGLPAIGFIVFKA